MKCTSLTPCPSTVIPAHAGTHFYFGFTACRKSKNSKIKIKMDDQPCWLLKSASSVRWDDGTGVVREFHSS